MPSPAPSPHNWSIFCLSHNILCGLQETLKRTTWLYTVGEQNRKGVQKKNAMKLLFKDEKSYSYTCLQWGEHDIERRTDVLHAVPDELLLSSLFFSEKNIADGGLERSFSSEKDMQ